MARPTKITKNLVSALEEIISPAFSGLSTDFIALTDDVLVMMLNDSLPKDENISRSVFKQWKSGNLPKEDSNLEFVDEFLSLIKKGYYMQQKFLLEKLHKETGQWQKWAWIIERKFDEWNLKKKQETTFPDIKPAFWED